MKKEKFMEMLAQAKEDEYGRLYVLGKYNNKIYFGTITTICEDIFVLNHSEECQDTAELYDRHFWNDDTLYCHVISTRHDENIKYKEPERIGEIKSNGNEFYSDYINAWISKADVEAYCEFLMNKINDLIKISNKYASLLEKQEGE